MTPASGGKLARAERPEREILSDTTTSTTNAHVLEERGRAIDESVVHSDENRRRAAAAAADGAPAAAAVHQLALQHRASLPFPQRRLRQPARTAS